MCLGKSDDENHVCACGNCTCGTVGESKVDSGEVCDDVKGSCEENEDRFSRVKLKTLSSRKFSKSVKRGYYILDEVECKSRINSEYAGDDLSSKDLSLRVNTLGLDTLVSHLNGIFNEFGLLGLHLVRHGSSSGLNVGLGLRSGRLGVFVEVTFTDDFMENRDVNMYAFVCALNSCVQRSNGIIRRVVLDSRMGVFWDINSWHSHAVARLLPKKLDVNLGETYVLFFEFGTSVGVACVDGYSSDLLDSGVYTRLDELGIIEPLDDLFDLDVSKGDFLIGVGLNTLKKSGIRVVLSYLDIAGGSMIKL